MSGEDTVVVVGKESVGKSELVASLTGDRPTASNFQGTTTRCERYSGAGYSFVDTPGIVLDADTEGTRAAVDALEEDGEVLLVVPATNVDDDLDDLLPVVEGRLGSVVVTYWDKVEDTEGASLAIDKLEQSLGVPVTAVDARDVEPVAADGGAAGAQIDDPFRDVIQGIEEGGVLPDTAGTQVGWGIEPPETVFEWDYVGPWVSVAFLLLPAALAVWFANSLAGELSPVVDGWMQPLVAWAAGLPEPLSTVLATEYGLLEMGPFLFVWAGPTIVIFAVVIGVYKNTGLVTRITVSLHPYMRRFGLTGRDLVRVVMGFGCNVPAVVNTRSCSDCTRKTTISAISFGSACSYQFPATLAVFAALGMAWLVFPYLAVLAASTFIYVAAIAPQEARETSLFVERRNFLHAPQPKAVAREAWSALREFFVKALPVFAAICVVAAALDRVGVIDSLGGALAPVMSVFALPADSALVVVLASIRKDGIALYTSEEAAVAALSPLEVLVAVYLAGVLLPCLVTAFTIAREVSAKYALKLMARQAAAAVVFAAALAWGGKLVLSAL